MTWMIYGANGYTGGLVARLAAERGMKPILAGRNQSQLAELANELKLPVRTFSLQSNAEVVENLKDVPLVLNCAGPFSSTFRPMLNGCLATKSHYLDVTGEIAIFEELFARDDETKNSGITAICGVGFDVVPTDCLAAMIKQQLPDATHLRLAIAGIGAGISRGTAKTMFEGSKLGGCVRSEGRLKRVPMAYKTNKFTFNHRETMAVTMPWGDIATAFRSTGIPNIEVYFATTTSTVMLLRTAELFRPLLATAAIQSFGKQILSKIAGPNADMRESGYCIVVGEAQNASGKKVSMRMRCPEGYKLTADSAVRSVEKIMAGNIAKGSLTPSMAFGSDFVKTLAGIDIEDIITDYAKHN